jgi:hypothetical protein
MPKEKKASFFLLTSLPFFTGNDKKTLALARSKNKNTMKKNKKKILNWLVEECLSCADTNISFFCEC